MGTGRRAPQRGKGRQGGREGNSEREGGQKRERTCDPQHRPEDPVRSGRKWPACAGSRKRGTRRTGSVQRRAGGARRGEQVPGAEARSGARKPEPGASPQARATERRREQPHPSEGGRHDAHVARRRLTQHCARPRAPRKSSNLALKGHGNTGAPSQNNHGGKSKGPTELSFLCTSPGD